MDSFLAINATETYPPTESDDLLYSLVFIDNLHHDFGSWPVRTSHSQDSAMSSPFKGKTAQVGHLLLKQLVRNTGSKVNWCSFVIVDERSLVVSIFCSSTSV